MDTRFSNKKTQKFFEPVTDFREIKEHLFQNSKSGTETKKS